MFTQGLQEMKETLDSRINDAHHISGRFTSKPRRDGTPSSSLPPSNPVKWAIQEENQELYIS